MSSDECIETEARHSTPGHFAATCHAEGGYYPIAEQQRQ